MKKTLILAFALLASLCACTKQIEIQEDSQKQTIIAHVNIATKVAYSENTAGGGSGLSSVWEEGDKFLAIQDGTTVIEFTLIDGAGSNQATFQAEAEGVTSETQWTAVLGSSASPHTSEIHCGYLGQSGKLSGIGAYNYVKALGEGLEPTFDFDGGEKLSYILRVKLPAGVKCIEYTPCGYNKITSSSSDIINLNSGEQDDYTSSSRVSTITLDSAASAGDIVYISVPCLDCSNTHNLTNSNKQHQNLIAGIVLTFLNDTEADATASTGVVINNDLREKGGKITTVNCSGMTLMSRPRPADAIEFQTSNVSADYHSSSYQRAASVYSYWAPYNLGASTASEAGRYLMFGEFQQHDLGVNPSTSIYAYYTSSSSGYMSMGHTNSKLIDNSNNTTFYSIQGSKYDAARVLWGTSWQMPHIIHLWAIYDNSENTQSIQGQCVRFTNSRTGNYIDVPVAGCYKNGSHNDTAYTVLWSADKNQRSATNAGWNAAYALYVKNDLSDKAVDRYELCNAIPVRPVLATSYVSDDPLPYNGPENSGSAPVWEEQVF